MGERIASLAMSPFLSPLRPDARSSCSPPPSSPLSDLSEFSTTPSPPSSPALLPMLDPAKRYPSPSSTSQSGAASPRKLDRDGGGDGDGDGDGPPPPKRRRMHPPPPRRRPRMTRHLDLDDVANSAACEEELGYLLRALRTKKKVVVIAGAGISVSAGIPDFRSSTGLFTTLRGQHGLRGSGKHLFDASVYKHDSSTSSFHSMVRELAHMTQAAQPTAFHHMLASLAHEGRLMRLYSQNVDCIDTNMKPLATNVPLNVKGPWPVTVQLHGGLAKMVCSKCGQLEDFDGSLFEGPEPPPCQQCADLDQVRTAVAGKRSHGIGRLRPRIVLYNEYNPDEEAIGNVSKADLRRGADAVLVVGTSLKIPGVRRLVKELCHTTRSRRDGFTAWINVDPEPQGAEFKDCWDLVVRGSSDDIACLAGLPRWDEPDIGSPSNWNVTGDEDVGPSQLEVVLDDRAPATLSPAKAAASGAASADEKMERAEEKPVLPSLAKPKILQKRPPPLPSSSPAASMLTPSSSPKPSRKRLPDARQSRLNFQQVTKAEGPSKPAAKADKDKAGQPAARPKTESKPVKLATIPKKPRKPRGPQARTKKEDAQAAKNMALGFRATKHVQAASTKARKPLPTGKSSPEPPRHAQHGDDDDHHHYAVPASADVSTPLSDRSSAPDSAQRQLLAEATKLPSLRDGGGSWSAGKENGGGKDGTLGHASRAPCTPPASHSRCASEGETISPQSVPHGMGTLIN